MNLNKLRLSLLLLVALFFSCQADCPLDKNCYYTINKTSLGGFVSCEYPDGRAGGSPIRFEQIVESFYDEYSCLCQGIENNLTCDSLKKVSPPEFDTDWVQFGTRVNSKDKKYF